MIKAFEIKNFKSHKKTEVEFKNLTVFCGANAVGKSSIIHGLLLLREAFISNRDFEYLDLKPNSVNVGTGVDALYQFATENRIFFNLDTSRGRFEFSFESKDSDMTKTLMYKSRDSGVGNDLSLIEKESLFNKEFQFISAARLGPQASYIKDDVVVDVHNQISVVEGRAEHFVHYLYRNKDKVVIADLRNPSANSTDLFYQTTAWEREISSDVNVVVKDLGNLGYELKYQFNTNSRDRGRTNEFKASNVGFGLSYVMPLIVAILSSSKDSIVLIENPEAHLHPNGQARLIELICLAAQSGVQIVLETHSDHIINGILVQTKKYQDTSVGIDYRNVSLYHFERDDEDHSTRAIPIVIQDQSKIINAPKGFFDQFTIDRKFLLGF